jgi:hypothetical protein
VVLGDDLDLVGFQAIEDDLVFGHGLRWADCAGTDREEPQTHP